MKDVHDIGSRIKCVGASDNVSVTAGGSGDNTLVTGQSVDRQAVASPISMPLAAVLAVRYKAILAQGETLSLAYSIEDSADGSTWATYGSYTASTAVQATGATGGSTERGVFEVNVDLGAARQYVRAKYTPDLSAANTDTATTAAVWVFGGFNSLPQ